MASQNAEVSTLEKLKNCLFKTFESHKLELLLLSGALSSKSIGRGSKHFAGLCKIPPS